MVVTPLAKLAEQEAFAFLVAHNHDRLEVTSDYIAATEEHFRDAIRVAINAEHGRLARDGWCPDRWLDSLHEPLSESDARHEAECAAADRAHDDREAA